MTTLENNYRIAQQTIDHLLDQRRDLVARVAQLEGELERAGCRVPAPRPYPAELVEGVAA